MIYAQGCVFPTVPGTYEFPFNEGHYTITSNQQVVMHTRKNGAPYVHANIQPHPEIWSGQARMDLAYVTAFQMVMPLDRFRWYHPTSFEPLRAEHSQYYVTLNCQPGTPCESTSPLDFKLLEIIDSVESRTGKNNPVSHIAFASALRKRIQDSGVTREHYTKKVLELAIMMMPQGSAWSLFRDYTPLEPHSESTASLKTNISRLIE